MFVFVLFFVLAGQKQKTSPLLISDGCCEQWRPTTDLLPEDGGGCVWPPSGDAKEFKAGGGLGGGLICHVNIWWVLSGFEP